MGFLKWFKSRENHLSPRPSEPPVSKNNTKISRNGSYLKALSKFNKWRQSNSLNSTNKCLKTHKKCNWDRSTLCINMSNCSEKMYDEIDTLSQNYYECNDGNSNESHINISKQLVYNEPVYSLPISNYLRLTDISGYKDYKEKSSQSNKYKNVVRRNILVTDLDSSKDTSFEKNFSDIQRDSSSNYVRDSYNYEFFSDLLVVFLDQITFIENGTNFNTVNGFIRKATFNSIEINYFQMKNNCSEGMYNNYSMLRKLHHPNITTLMGVAMNVNQTIQAILLERTDCSLYEIIHNKRNHISTENCRSYTQQIINAVIYLQDRQYIHSNICSENIMMNVKAGIVKLCGFELATSNKKNELNETLALNTNYRKQFTKHFYQAPELLTEDNEYIKTKYQADVYGICITLWEMLNSVIPYFECTYNELNKIFALKNAQLPTYEKDRCFPYNYLLQKGLEINVECRIPNAVALNNLFKDVNVGSKKLDRKTSDKKKFGEFQVKQTKDVNVNYYQYSLNRTSTVKKRSENIENNTINLEAPFSPIAGIHFLTENISSSDCHCDLIQNKNQQLFMPSKRYSVNIKIKTNYKDDKTRKPNNTAFIEERVHQLVTINSRVKEKINKFESFATSTRSFNHTEGFEKENNTKSDQNDFGINKTYRSLYQGVPTDDFYIDDDLPTDSNCGPNFILN